MTTTFSKKNIMKIDPDRQFHIEYDSEYYNPTKPEVFKPIANAIKTLQQYYQQFETDETKLRLQVLRELSSDLRNNGIENTFLTGGSLAFGLAEKDSDFDIIYVGDTTWYGSNENYICGLANLHPFLTKELSNRMGRPIEVCGSLMNLEIMMSMVRQEILEGFEFYYPVLNSRMRSLYGLYQINRPIDDSINETIAQIETLRTTNNKVDAALRDCFISNNFDESFIKYHKRLAQQGITVPPEILELELKVIDKWNQKEFLESINVLN